MTEKLTYIYSVYCIFMACHDCEREIKTLNIAEAWSLEMVLRAEMVLQYVGAQGKNVGASQVTLDSRQHALDPLDDAL